MITNVVFDIGNVLLNFKPLDYVIRFTKVTGMTKEELVALVFKSPEWLMLDKGLIPEREAPVRLSKKSGIDSRILHQIFDEWKQNILTPITENIELAIRLKKTNYYGLYALSNFIKEAEVYVRKVSDLFEIFDGAVLSCDIGVAKPDKEIYLYLVQRYDLNPEECVFIDDIVDWLVPAKAMGMKTILYQSSRRLKLELVELGLKF